MGKIDVGVAIPYFRSSDVHERYLADVVNGLTAQSCQSWHAVIAVDGLSSRISASLSHQLKADGRFTILEMPERIGPGPCRNAATRSCIAAGADVVLFQDADDIPHPDRVVETISIFAQRPEVDFVYSTFGVMDENGSEIPYDALTPSVREILEHHRSATVEGPNAWIAIGTETGYMTLTSTVAVRAALAAECPFPASPVSQDSHTWYRMSAAGSAFACSDMEMTRYRIRTLSGGGAIRTQYGPTYYWMKALTDLDGFSAALRIALRRGTISPEEAPLIMARFYNRLARTMELEDRHDISDTLRGLSVPCDRRKD